MQSVKDRYAALQPEVDVADLATARANLAAATTVAQVKAVLEDVLDALDAPTQT